MLQNWHFTRRAPVNKHSDVGPHMLHQVAKLRTREQNTFEVVEFLGHGRLALQSFDEGEDKLIELAAERMMRIGADLVKERCRAEGAAQFAPGRRYVCGR